MTNPKNGVDIISLQGVIVELNSAPAVGISRSKSLLLATKIDKAIGPPVCTQTRTKGAEAAEDMFRGSPTQRAGFNAGVAWVIQQWPNLPQIYASADFVEVKEPVDCSKAAADVINERNRQVNVEKYSRERDDDWGRNGELAQAASCYAGITCERPPQPFNWPWGSAWWKPSTRRRNLVKAGALILAEIERLDRLEAKKSESK